VTAPFRTDKAYTLPLWKGKAKSGAMTDPAEIGPIHRIRLFATPYGATHHDTWPPGQTFAGRCRRREPQSASRSRAPSKKRAKRFAGGRSTPPEGPKSCAVAGHQLLLQVVADYTRLNAVLAAGLTGHRRASGPQYPGLAGCWVEFGEELPDAAVDLVASLLTVPFSEPSP
jgi:hypothetical protein